jgi:U3 small nucleolar RNA-associated protein 10
LVNLFRSALTPTAIAMWNDKQLGVLSKAVILQIAVFPNLSVSGRSDCLPSCVAHLASSMSREDQLKDLNLGILMHTRSEDGRVRQLALRSCVEAWTSAGSLLSRQ